MRDQNTRGPLIDERPEVAKINVGRIWTKVDENRLAPSKLHHVNDVGYSVRRHNYVAPRFRNDLLDQ